MPASHGYANASPTDGEKTCEGKDQGVDDNSNGEGDDENDGDESDDDERNEEGDAAVAEDGAKDMDQLSDEILYLFISGLIYLVRLTSIATTTPVATSPPRPLAIPASLASTPMCLSIAMPSQFASTPVRPSVATPTQLATPTQCGIATPARIALPGAVADVTSAHAFDLFSNGSLPVPPSAPYYGSSPTTAQPCFNFNQFPSQELSALGPELDSILQADTTATFPQQWGIPTSFQWNYSDLGSAESDAFISASLASVNNNDLTAPSGVDPFADFAYSGFGIPSLSLGGSPQPRRNLPLLPPAPSADDSSGSPQSNHLPVLPPVPSFGYSSPPCPDHPTLGRSRRKPVPSLRAHRDNMIGKENGSSVSLEKVPNNPKGKRPASDGLTKKSK